MSGYNFTERVRGVLAMAREEAHGLSHEYVGTEHILLALLRGGDGVASAVIENLGVDAGEVRDTVLRVVRAGTAHLQSGADLPYTSRAKKVLELAIDESRVLHHSYVGTEHLLLGLLREGTGIAAQVLAQAGLTTDGVRGETLRLLGSETPQTLPPPPAARGRATPPPAGPPAALVSPRLDRVLAAAVAAARGGGQERAGPAQLLLALLGESEGMAAAVLERLSVDRQALRAATEAASAAASPPPGDATAAGARPSPFTAPAGAARRAAEEAAIAAREEPVHTGHLLLGLLRESPHELRELLERHVVTAERVERELSRLRG